MPQQTEISQCTFQTQETGHSPKNQVLRPYIETLAFLKFQLNNQCATSVIKRRDRVRVKKNLQSVNLHSQAQVVLKNTSTTMKKMTEVIKKELSEHSADIFSETPKRHQKEDGNFEL